MCREFMSEHTKKTMLINNKFNGKKRKSRNSKVSSVTDIQQVQINKIQTRVKIPVVQSTAHLFKGIKRFIKNSVK